MGQTMNPEYRAYRPKWYRRRMPIFWWLRSLSYTRFITRELTSLVVAYTAIVLLVHARAATAGEDVYRRFLTWLEHPAVLVLHAVVLLGLLFHTLTWLSLAPRAIQVRFAGRKVPDGAVLLAHYGAWIAVSTLLVWLLVGR